MRRGWIVYGTAVVLIAMMSGCLQYTSQGDIAPTEDSVVIGMSGNISGFYPWMQYRDITTLSINKNFFNSLVELDASTHKFIPALANSWNNPNNLTWRFFLRQDVRFHNGNVFSAEDVQFTIEYLMNLSQYFNEELGSISEVVCIDNGTVDIITDRPFPLLLNKLITVYILDEDYTEQAEATNVTWPCGTGAYKLAEYVPGDLVRIVWFDEYWKGPPQIKEARFVLGRSAEENKRSLTHGDVDIVQIDAQDIAVIKQTPGLSVKSCETTSVIYLGFDCRINDSYGFPEGENPTADPRVRRAMYHAIDVDSIIAKYLPGSATPATQLVTDDLFGFNETLSRLPFNVLYAKELLRDAGYASGFSIAFDYPDIPLYVNISEEIVRQLSAVNITAVPRVLPYGDFLSTISVRNTSFFIMGISAIDAESTIRLLLCTPDGAENGTWNYGTYSNPEVDRIAELLLYTLNPSIRKMYLQTVFSIVASDVAVIPLFSRTIFYGVNDALEWTPRTSTYIWVEEIGMKSPSG